MDDSDKCATGLWYDCPLDYEQACRDVEELDRLELILLRKKTVWDLALGVDLRKPMDGLLKSRSLAHIDKIRRRSVRDDGLIHLPPAETFFYQTPDELLHLLSTATEDSNDRVTETEFSLHCSRLLQKGVGEGISPTQQENKDEHTEVSVQLEEIWKSETSSRSQVSGRETEKAVTHPQISFNPPLFVPQKLPVEKGKSDMWTKGRRLPDGPLESWHGKNSSNERRRGSPATRWTSGRPSGGRRRSCSHGKTYAGDSSRSTDHRSSRYNRRPQILRVSGSRSGSGSADHGPVDRRTSYSPR